MKTIEEDVRAGIAKLYELISSRWKSEPIEIRVREIFYNQKLPDNLVDANTGYCKVNYAGNKIRTTKYTPLTFLPLNIFFQFTNIANSYFLFIIILGFFNIFGVQNPAMQAVPLVIIVVLTAAKDGFEDYRRAIADYETNTGRVHKLVGVENYNATLDNIGMWRRIKKKTSTWLGRRNRGSESDIDLDVESMITHDSSGHVVKFVSTPWKKVIVGDILRVRKNEEVPADCIILKTSHEKGLCYVETKNLDGETNLKSKRAVSLTTRAITRLSDLKRMMFNLKTELPNKDLYHFHGVLNGENEGYETLNLDNLLLRGCVLRNTDYAIGIVIAAGVETKIMLNSGVTPTKKSKISRDLNYYVFVNFVLLFVLCFVAGLINGLYYGKKSAVSRIFFEYNEDERSAAANGVLSFFVNLIMYQTLVPISLYVTVEVIKSFQAMFIYEDADMYYEKLDLRCTPKSWSIADDLGQVEYVFSDKTGTLTQNVMEFAKCVVGGRPYGNAAGVDVNGEKEMYDLLENRNPYFQRDKCTFSSIDFVQRTNDEVVHEFLFALAVCHTVVVENGENGISYSGESPDEVALVSFAKDMGVVYLGEVDDDESGWRLLWDNGKEVRYRLLCVIPFSSARGRMPVVVEDGAGKVWMYMKGADNAVIDRSVKGPWDESVGKELHTFAQEGLRTLVVGRKELDRKKFEEFYEVYESCGKNVDISEEERRKGLDDAANGFEVDVTIIGATAIDDKLQDEVPETIEKLRRGGIKVWVLTGDKIETAISIGYSCAMLSDEMEILIIEGKDCNIIENVIDGYLNKNFGYSDPNDEKATRESLKDHSIPDGRYALVVDGMTLGSLFDECSEKVQIKFLMLAKKCCSVLCCRVSPSQKADVVKLVRGKLDVITIAIGDGANDVSMIQCANIGIGIAGEEGRQAAMSSDYAIGQFKYLQKLILVHGKWSYQRLSRMVPCFFYKNLIYVMPLFWYGIFTNFDGTYLYEYTFLMLFNIFFTSMPVVTLGVLDQDVSSEESIERPELYRNGIGDHRLRDCLNFGWFMLLGIFQSCVAFFFPFGIFVNGKFATHNGLSIDAIFGVGVFSIHIAIIACNLCVLLEQRRWDGITIGLHLASNLLLFIWTVGWSAHVAVFYGLGLRCYQSASFWACIAVGVVIASVPVIARTSFEDERAVRAEAKRDNVL